MYRPTKGADSLGVSCPSAFLEAMENAFGDRPFRLNETHIVALNAMAGVFGDNKENPYKKLIHLIEKHGQIEVWPEY
jgi:hypothetical protein